jgi:hypothetical protein
MLKKLKQNKNLPMIASVLIVGTFCSLTVLRLRAVSINIELQAEGGTLSLPQRLVAETPQSGSSGSYVIFGQSENNNSIVKYVSPTGSNSNSGDQSSPWQTIRHGLENISPGETLEIAGGTYQERIVSPIIQAGLPSTPVIVKAKNTENVTVNGLLHLSGANYWYIDGVNVSWDDNLTTDQNNHMAKMIDGIGWRWTNSRFSNSMAYSALLVSDGQGWEISGNVFENARPVPGHGVNQDHLLYISSGLGGGVVKRNIFSGSQNGRGIKIGPPDASTTPLGNIQILYNTFYNNLGPSNIQLSYGASNNLIERNIFLKSSAGYANITGFNLSGTNNLVQNNVGWESSSVVQANIAGLVNGGGNLFIDPSFANPSEGDFNVYNQAASVYGRYSP